MKFAAAFLSVVLLAPWAFGNVVEHNNNDESESSSLSVINTDDPSEDGSPATYKASGLYNNDNQFKTKKLGDLKASDNRPAQQHLRLGDKLGSESHPLENGSILKPHALLLRGKAQELGNSKSVNRLEELDPSGSVSSETQQDQPNENDASSLLPVEDHNSDRFLATTVLSADSFETDFGRWIPSDPDGDSQRRTAFPSQGNYSVLLRGDLPTNGIITANFSSSGLSGYQVTFDFYHRGLEVADGLLLQHSSNGVSWTTAASWLKGFDFTGNNLRVDNNLFTEDPFVSPLAGADPFFIRFVNSGADQNDHIFLDSIVVEGVLSPTPSPTTASPTTPSPTTSSPTTASPTTASPTTASPTTASPTTGSPTIFGTTIFPLTASPTTDSPTTASPTTASPTTASPTTASPTTSSPTGLVIKDLIDYESFESGFGIWNPSDPDGDSQRRTAFPSQGNYTVLLRGNTPLGGIISTSFLTAGYVGYCVAFNFYHRGLENGDGLLLQHSSNGVSWTTAASWVKGTDFTGNNLRVDNNLFTEDPFVHPLAGQPVAHIRFVNSGADQNDHIFLDEVTIFGLQGPSPSPTTASPTTPSPTTASPTTASPTTDSPTTDSPTTDSPTTASPTTDSPTTESPTTDSPTTASPTTDSPTTDSPTTASPTTASPTTASPTTDSPTTDSPTTASPTTASPTTDSPTTASPTTASPTTASPTTASPTTASPTTASPTTASPTTASPTTASPTTASPTTASPTTASPTTAYPTIFGTTIFPLTGSPTTASPTTASPTVCPPATCIGAPPASVSVTQECSESFEQDFGCWVPSDPDGDSQRRKAFATDLDWSLLLRDGGFVTMWFSTRGYRGYRVTFDVYVRSLEYGESLILEHSADGTNFSPAESWMEGSEFCGKGLYCGNVFELNDFGSLDQFGNITIQFRMDGSDKGDHAFLDKVTVEGINGR